MLAIFFIIAVTLMMIIQTFVISIVMVISCVPIIHDIEYLRVQFVIVPFFF